MAVQRISRRKRTYQVEVILTLLWLSNRLDPGILLFLTIPCCWITERGLIVVSFDMFSHHTISLWPFSWFSGYAKDYTHLRLLWIRLVCFYDTRSTATARFWSQIHQLDDKNIKWLTWAPHQFHDVPFAGIVNDCDKFGIKSGERSGFLLHRTLLY